MRQRVIGAALIVLGVVVLLFMPVEVVALCARGCREQGSSSLSDWVDYPPGWGTLAWPMLIIGTVLVATGFFLLLKRRRSTGSASKAE
jgi:LPXTG-motif cell wall-anchored protein